MKGGFYHMPESLHHSNIPLPETHYPSPCAGLSDPSHWGPFSPPPMPAGWPVPANDSLPMLSPPMTISGDPQDMAADLYCQQIFKQEQNEMAHRLSCSMDRPMGIYMTPTPEMNSTLALSSVSFHLISGLLLFHLV